MSVAEQPWRGTPLPPGRHKIPRSEVRASQRENRKLREIAAEMVSRTQKGGFTPPTPLA